MLCQTALASSVRINCCKGSLAFGVNLNHPVIVSLLSVNGPRRLDRIIGCNFLRPIFRRALATAHDYSTIASLGCGLGRPKRWQLLGPSLRGSRRALLLSLAARCQTHLLGWFRRTAQLPRDGGGGNERDSGACPHGDERQRPRCTAHMGFDTAS